MPTALRAQILGLFLLPSLALLAWLPAAPVSPPAVRPPAADSPLLDSLLRSDPALAPVIKRAADYEVQIIYTQINRDAQNRPHFTQHNFHLNARQYFNPASLVKLPVAALALEKLNQLQQPGLTRNSPFSIGTAFRCQTPVPYAAPADSDQLNTVGNYIKRMLLVSDNGAYNRLYEFLGQRPLNERLWSLGYPDVRIVRRFAPCDTAANRYTNPFTFYASGGQPIYQQPAAVNSRALSFPLGRITKGRAYQAGGRIIQEPYDFTTANYLPLQSITDILKAILFPNDVTAGQQFRLAITDYAFLRQYLHLTPHASKFSFYRSSRFYDAYKKYLYYGRSADASVQPSLHIYNVVGMSHGYLADVAYFADSAQQSEFMLSAVIYVNKDGILNDGAYEYTSVGLPFLGQLGKRLYQYEASRPRAVKPHLESLFTAEGRQ
ncbi:serine hydrolase [Hymenobacter chitinivorans]|uniref:Beta-lactamase family protein n=1 Tax=Hymenobacter chitinivorans DSM 11115 TaxID=1121954 RepID=A0A2M9AT11_9BACT|nr:serine hydrolase [Hymenobacter chitinivorans]PJJ48840.1 beta-lactamase family protein [Hymenobacter chitinivorans DSM 11115]